MRFNAVSLRVRRGVDRVDIYSTALSQNLQWLAVSTTIRRQEDVCLFSLLELEWLGRILIPLKTKLF
ncbi:hypothetical protein HID58_065429 [Brassica napus]|uniref:Uncharacterized protein n=1 Tax=Brassica napus TaxID=3708 RepID=A0ABQ7ZD72_BRANA|nr:hypothetical protein HID58_065429 [Brassica napus]